MHKIAWFIAPYNLEIATSPLFAPYKAYKISPTPTILADEFLNAFSEIYFSTLLSKIFPEPIKAMFPV